MGQPDLTSHFLVHKALAGARKLCPSSDSRLPITLEILSLIMAQTLPVTRSPYYSVLLKAMLSLSFYGFLRPGELTHSHNNLQLSNVNLSQTEIILHFTSYKHSNGNTFTLKIPTQAGPTCPVNALTCYLRQRGTRQGPFSALTGAFPSPITNSSHGSSNS